MNTWTISPAKTLSGVIRVPGDKSISHRAVMLGALASGNTEIDGFLPGADCLSTIRCFQALGAEISHPAPDHVLVRGVGDAGLREPEDVLNVGNSGTTLYLTLGILAGQPFYSVLTGDSSIRRRPVKRVSVPLETMGATLRARQGNTLPPVTVLGGKLRACHYAMPTPSAQVKSSVLLAGLFAEGVTSVEATAVTRDHTERMLRAFGVEVISDGGRASVRGPARLNGQHITVPGDISSAAFFLVAGSLVSGAEILIENVGVNPTRCGILDALRAMGADIAQENEREAAGEPVADLRVRAASLRGIRVAGEMIPRLIDEVPVLAVAAAGAAGDTEIRDAGALRIKETDRIATTAGLLRAFGVSVEELPDGMVIHGLGDPRALNGAAVDSQGDHRIAMAAAVAGLVARGETIVHGAESADVSFPGFYERLQELRARTMPAAKRCITVAIDGPAGAGKSTVARQVAQALGYAYVDSGAMYRAVAWKALAEQVDFTDAEALGRVARALRIEFQPGEDGQRVLADGQDITAAIRTPEVSAATTRAAAVPAVRAALAEQQRRLGAGGCVVMEGRDIGTVIFPDAEVKVYLDASLAERARRRQKDYAARGQTATTEAVETEIRDRDARDAAREQSPLRPAADATVVNTDNLSIREVVERVLELCRKTQSREEP